MTTRNVLAAFPSKSELRESKDEIVVGELIRGLSRSGWVCTRIESDPAHHQLTFVLPGDEVLTAAHVSVDRRQTSPIVGSTMGTRTLLGFGAEMSSDGPGVNSLVATWRDAQRASTAPPIAGEVRIHQQLGRTVARTYHLVDLDDYIQGTNVGTSALVDWAREQVDQLREALLPES